MSRICENDKYSLIERGGIMNIEEKAYAFREILSDYVDGNHTIIKRDINKAIGITINEVNEAVKDLSYFGKRSHYYLIDEVAIALAVYMNDNTKQQHDNICAASNTYAECKIEKGKKVNALNSKGNKKEYWKIL